MTMERVRAYFLFACFVFPLPVFAQAAGEGETLTTFKDIIAAGGWPMQIIIWLSVLATFLVIYFIFTLRANVLYPRKLIRDAEDAAEEGDVEVIEALCRENDSPAARIIGAAAEQIASEQRADYMIVRDAIEDEGARQAATLWQRIQYLLDIAVVAPMVGLLGTVLGMLKSFSRIRTGLGVVGVQSAQDNMVNPTALAQGVTQALITTAGGLMVGIAAMILYAVFRGRVNTLVAGLESACSRVLRRFATKRQTAKY